MYLALARKYRPQRFADLIGQTPISKTLQNAIQQSKVYPAMIFSGMKGVGKTSTARILAKALNCEKGPAVEPCNECTTCREITEDISTDYLEIDGASNNGVNEVRSLRETVKYKPLKNRFRVVVIDEVHMLTGPAWNALLKTIEEPPEHTIFIMATTDFHKIPATIVSRCQHFEFKRIPHETIKTVLTEICRKEGVKISDYSLYLISRAAEGSLRDAKKILDQAIALSSGDIHDQETVEILGIIDEEVFIRLTRCVLSQDRKGIIEQIALLTERGTDLRFFYNEYLKFLRDLLIIKSIEKSEKLHSLNPENIVDIREILKDVSELELLRYFNTLKEMEQTIKNTENPMVITEYLFLKLSYFPALLSIEEAIKGLKASSTAIADAPPPPPELEDGDEQPAAESNLLEEFRQKVAAAGPRLASAVSGVKVSLKGNTLMIEIPGDAASAAKLITDQKQLLKDIALQVFRREIRVEIIVQQRKERPSESETIEKLKEDKVIKSLKQTIKGKLIAIENISGEKDE